MKKIIIVAVLLYLYLFQTEHGANLMNKVLSKAKQPINEITDAKDKMEERNDEVVSDLEDVNQ